MLIRISFECLTECLSIYALNSLFSLKIGDVETKSDNDCLTLINGVIPKTSIMNLYIICVHECEIVESLNYGQKTKCFMSISAIVNTQLYNEEMYSFLIENINNDTVMNKIESLLNIKDQVKYTEQWIYICTKLCTSSSESIVDIYKRLLEHGQFDVFNIMGKWVDYSVMKTNVSDDTFPGATMLHFCSLYNNIKYIPILIENGANINEKDMKRNTPLHYSAKNGNVDVCKLLINSGCILSSPNADSMLPLHMAVMSDHIDTFLYLSDKYKYMVKEQGVPNVYGIKSKNGITPLLLSVIHKSLNIFKYLISNKSININYRDAFGKNALMYSIEHGNQSYLSFLIDCSADINITDNQNENAAFYAVRANSMEVLKILISKSMNLNCKNSSDQTLLHVAGLMKNKDMCSYLLENGLDEGSVDVHGNTYKTYLNTVDLNDTSVNNKQFPLPKKVIKRKH